MNRRWLRWPTFERAPAVSNPDTTWRAVLTPFAASRLGVLAIGLLAVFWIGYANGRPPYRLTSNELINLPVRWDTGWYAGIARNGYQRPASSTAQQNLNFFPAYPMLVRAATALLSPVLLPDKWVWWIAVWCSLGCFFAALCYLHRLTALEVGSAYSDTAVALLCVYPFSIFFSAGYTEGLFLLGVVAAIYHFRRHQHVRAAGAGLLVGLSRPNGVLLAATLAAFAIQGRYYRLKDGRGSAALAIAAAPIGLLVYSAYVWRVSGDPFFWAKLQIEAWGRTASGPQLSLLRQFPPGPFFPDAAAELFVFAALLPLTFRLGWPYGLHTAVSALLPIVNGGVQSFGRYSSVIFPLFIWLSVAIPARHRTAALTAMALFQGFFAALFFTWRGPY